MTWRGHTLAVILRLSIKTGAATLLGKVRPVLTVVPGAADAVTPHRDGGSSLIDEIVRESARMLAEALHAGVDDNIARFGLPPNATRTVAGWWCATVRTSPRAPYAAGARPRRAAREGALLALIALSEPR
jgi:hypothetical protein